MGRVLVTGASGFIGRAVAVALTAAGYEVRAAVRRLPTRPFPTGIAPVLHGDFEAAVDWRQLVAGMDFVVHSAGLAHSTGTGSARYDRINRGATADLADASRQAGVKRLVFISSVRAQSGPTAERVLTEADEPRPTDPYGRSKLAAEEALRQAGLPYTVLRPVLVYGPGAKGNLRLLAAMAALPVPLPFGAFRSARSLVGVHNLAAAIVHVLGLEATCRETYLVAETQPVSLAEIIAALRKGAGRSAGLFNVPPALVRCALAMIGRSSDWPALNGTLIADPAKLVATGWCPKGDTLAGLASLGQGSFE